MKYGLSHAVVLAIVFVSFGFGASLAEDVYAPSSVGAPAVPAPAAPEASAAVVPAEVSAAAAEVTPASVNDPDVLWLWGEVVSVDAQKNELTVKYLDYESDNEKEIIVVADDKAGYEGIKSLAELKALDTVSIDYLVLNGKNIAKNISAEKPESMEPAKDEASPAGTPPDAQGASQPVPDINPSVTE